MVESVNDDGGERSPEMTVNSFRNGVPVRYPVPGKKTV